MTELETLKARREELETARKALDEKRDLEQAIKREKQAIADEEALAKVKETHDDDSIAVVETRLGSVILGTPKPVHFQRFSSSKVTSADQEAFVKSCLLHPSKPDFSALIEALPGVVITCANACAQLAGVQTEAIAKK